MSAFGNLSGSEDYHQRALQLNADKLLELATRPGQVKTKDIAMASIYFGKMKAHYYSLADKRSRDDLYNQARASYDSFLRHAGVPGVIAG